MHVPHVQVLANMLANAVKFTDAGEIIVSAEVERLADGGASGRQRFHQLGQKLHHTASWLFAFFQLCF